MPREANSIRKDGLMPEMVHTVCDRRAKFSTVAAIGYNISALTMEHVLLDHPNVAQCAVVGISDYVYGQTVGAVLYWLSQLQYRLILVCVVCSNTVSRWFETDP
mmetsp:Transcript_30521/g.50721  ORF Transcript_30521/g.50721 Transcript_30521/m.50721 type:complete len:104 (-) Transcript_30521:135-446(-)